LFLTLLPAISRIADKLRPYGGGAGPDGQIRTAILFRKKAVDQPRGGKDAFDGRVRASCRDKSLTRIHSTDSNRA